VAGLEGDAVEELYCEVCEVVQVDGQGGKKKKKEKKNDLGPSRNARKWMQRAAGSNHHRKTTSTEMTKKELDGTKGMRGSETPGDMGFLVDASYHSPQCEIAAAFSCPGQLMTCLIPPMADEEAN
jgi:hypothetical protein